MSEHHHFKENGDTPDSWVHNTHLFRQWESIKHEINRHKWFESEKAGHDIGWERAAVDWTIRHSKDFFKPQKG